MAGFRRDSRHAFADFGDNFAERVSFMRMCFSPVRPVGKEYVALHGNCVCVVKIGWVGGCGCVCNMCAHVSTIRAANQNPSKYVHVNLSIGVRLLF